MMGLKGCSPIRTLLFLFTCVFSVFVVSLFASPHANAATPPFTISDDSTGGDCTLIGTWAASTKTCTLTADLSIPSGTGIIVPYGSDGITIDGAGYAIASVSGGAAGISMQAYYGNATVRNLTIQNFGVGIDVFHDSASNTWINVEDCIIRNTQIGIYGEDAPSGNLLVNHNTLESNGTAIYLASTSNSLITNNYISGNAIGIDAFFYANGNKIRGNTIIDNDQYGLKMVQSYGNRIYRNNFIDNAVQAYHIADGYNWYGGDNLFNLPLPEGGNYWSNWTTPDNNGDGIVDNVYYFNYNHDDLPWTSQDGWKNIGRPSLSLGLPDPFWASYADYLNRELSISWVITNNGESNAYNIQITGTTNRNGVTLLTTLPYGAGDIASGASSSAVVFKYHVPAEVMQFHTSTTASAQDGMGITYSYP